MVDGGGALGLTRSEFETLPLCPFPTFCRWVLAFDSTANQQLAIGNSPKSAMPLGYHTRVSTPLKPTKNIQSLPTLDPTLKGGGRIKFERRVTLLSLAAGFPAVLFVHFYSGTTTTRPRCSGQSIYS